MPQRQELFFKNPRKKLIKNVLQDKKEKQLFKKINLNLITFFIYWLVWLCGYTTS
jgi:hypothetical protein